MVEVGVVTIGLGLLLLSVPFSLNATERGLLLESSTILGLLDESFELNIMPTDRLCESVYKGVVGMDGALEGIASLSLFLGWMSSCCDSLLQGERGALCCCWVMCSFA